MKKKIITIITYILISFNTNLLSEQVLSLPMHSELELDQINFICEKINSFLK